jgi:hypothetical protein
MRDARRTRRAHGARPVPATAWHVLALLLLALVTIACGPQSTPVVEPTPSPTEVVEPSPTAGCGNGIVDPGEQCDGEDFCVNCNFAAVSGCCQFADQGTICVADDLGGIEPCIEDLPEGRFMIGGTCSGDPCDSVIPGCHRSACADQAIEPVSICCEIDDRCQATVATSASQLATLVVFKCGDSNNGRVVVGTCGGDGHCVAGH